MNKPLNGIPDSIEEIIAVNIPKIGCVDNEHRFCRLYWRKLPEVVANGKQAYIFI
jgi:hypothetical protein